MRGDKKIMEWRGGGYLGELAYLIFVFVQGLDIKI